MSRFLALKPQYLIVVARMSFQIARHLSNLVWYCERSTGLSR